MMTTCLENYYNFLDLEENVDVDTLVLMLNLHFIHYMMNILKFMV